MRQLTELDVYILKQEFPQLSLTEDPDIERYFEFRSLNRQAEALRLYNTKLIHRYPDNKMRVRLMTYYRKRDYRFHILLTDSLVQLANRTVIQVKRVIIFFADTIAPLKHAAVYTIIKVCEKVINAISSDRFAAIAFTEKYARYAERLKYHVSDMQQAADIIRMYITDTISSVREYREERDRKDAQEKTRKAIQKVQASVIDFSKIVFTKQQIDSIIISSSITRVEDKVLAYIMKYWDHYADGAFENMLLLYSRKYGTNHYAVFHAIKIGRTRNWKDEELLHAVLANVAQGYYYSITGDLYLQRAWKQLKLNPEPEFSPAQTKALPAPTVKTVKQAKHLPQQTEKASVKKDSKAEKVSSAKRKQKKAEKIVQVNTVSTSEPVITAVKKISQTTTAAVTASIPEAGTPSIKPIASIKSETSKLALAQPMSEKAAPSVQIYPINSPKGLPVSIAETVKKVTGKSYGVYRDLFFKEVRSAIRTILQHSMVQKLSFFGTEQNDAENIIYEFLETNYSLEPIIRLWAKENL